MNDKIKICLWASTQENNIGVLDYGNEEENMFKLCDKVECYLNKYDVFEVHRNRPEWGLIDNVIQERMVNPDFVIELHSNAGSKINTGEGTEIFCNLENVEGVYIAQQLYNAIAPVSKGKDRGIKDGMHLHDIRETSATAILVELFFHDNEKEVREWKHKINQYAKAIEIGICNSISPTLLNPVPTINKVLSILNRVEANINLVKQILREEIK